MEMLEWIPVEQAGQIETVCELAREIWTDRYLGVYGSMELDYLLRTWQSPGAVRRQIDGGHMEYRLICYDGAEVGYAALREKEDALWVYHAYIRGEYHGNRTVTGMQELIERECPRICGGGPEKQPRFGLLRAAGAAPPGEADMGGRPGFPDGTLGV